MFKVNDKDTNVIDVNDVVFVSLFSTDLLLTSFWSLFGVFYRLSLRWKKQFFKK